MIRFFHQLKKVKRAWPCVGCEHLFAAGDQVAITGCPWMQDQIIPHISIVGSWENLDKDVLEIILQCKYADPKRVEYIRGLWNEEKPFHFRKVFIEEEQRGMPCKGLADGWLELI